MVGWLVGDGASRASEVRLAVPRCLVITITLRLSATITNYLLPLTTIDHRQSPTAHQNFTHQNLSAIRGPHILSAVPPMAPVQGKKPQAPGHHDRRVSAAVPRGRRRRNDGLRAPARVRLLSYRQRPSPSITIHRWIAWPSSLAPLSINENFHISVLQNKQVHHGARRPPIRTSSGRRVRILLDRIKPIHRPGPSATRALRRVPPLLLRR